MKLFNSIIVCLLAYQFSFGQVSRKIDSLKAVINSDVADTSKVWALYALADCPIPLEEKSDYVQQGITLSEKLGFYEGEMRGLFKLSFGNSSSGNWAKGLEVAYKGYYKALVAKDRDHELNFMNMIAMSYQKQRDFKKGLAWSSRAINKIENGYPKLGINVWAAYHQSAAFYAELNQPDSAIIWADRSIEVAIEKKINPMLVGYSYEYKGDAYVKKRDFGLALKNYEIAINYLKIDPFSEQEVERQLAKMYIIMGDTINAEKYALQAYTGTLTTSNPDVKMDVCEILAQIYEPQDKAKAYPFLKDYHTLRGEFFNKEKYNQAYTIEQEEKQKTQAVQQALKEAKSKEKQNILFGILGFLALLISILGYFIFQKQKANRLLQEQKHKIESTLSELRSTQTQLIQSEKLASLGELTAGIAHEIQNPLNFVNNFSELSVDLANELKDEIKKPEKDWDLIEDLTNDLASNQEKINHHGKRAAAIVTGMLQHARTSTGKKEPTDLNPLADEYLRLSYHGLRAKDSTFNAQMVTDFDPAVGMVEVIPQDIGRVFLNIINNAFYATQQRRKEIEKLEIGKLEAPYEPMVSISSKRTDGSVEFRIKDNGTGIPDEVKARIFQPFFTTKPTGQGTGLGLSLAYDIVVKGHGGALEVESVEGEGTEFIVKLNIANR